MSRTTATLVACLTLLASACGADHPTAPDGNAALAAMAGSDPSPLTASAEAVALQVNLSWADNSPNETGFEVHRALGTAGTFARIASTAANATVYSDGGLQQTTTYCYKVRAFRVAGSKTSYSAFSNAACAATAGPPAAPANVTVTPGYYGEVFVAWSASPTAWSYKVDRAPVPAGPWDALVATLTGLQFTDNGRPLEQQVCYRIGAVNPLGTTLSAARCTTPPAAPTSLAVSASVGGGLDVLWTDASSAEDGFEVQRAVSDYAFAVIGTTPANATSYYDGSVAADTRYWYRVRARKDGGYSLYSPWADGISASAPPDAPTNFRTFPTGSSTVSLSWSSTSSNGSGFRIERSLNGGSFATLATISWSQQEFTDNEAPGDVEGCYRVFAFNGKGDSPATTPDCSRPINGPTDFVATTAGSDAIDLTWTDNSVYESGYEVHRIECTVSYGYYSYPYCYIAQSFSLPAGTTTFHVSGLAAGSYYDFEVVATATKNGALYYSNAAATAGVTDN